jgi:hypothetical protein
VILAPLTKYDFASSRVEMISAQIEAHMSTLVQVVAADIFTKTTLAPKLYIIQNNNNNNNNKVPLSSMAEMEATTLTAAVAEFYKSLGRVMTVTQCDRITNNELCKLAKTNVGLMIVEGYRQIYDAVRDPTNNYASPSLVVPHSITSIQKFFVMDNV